MGESVSKIYKLKINNVKPKIEIGLDSSYYFNENESTTIEVDAVGTNNVYTWYMSDLKNGDYKVLSEAVIQEPSSGEILYNLAQEDMVALRVTFRMGYAIPNPVNALDGTETRYPFAALVPAEL